MEPGETPEQGVRRELEEELSFSPKEVLLWTDRRIGDFRAYIFEVILDKELSELTLHEGAAMGLFTEKEIRKMPLAWNYNDVYDEYFKTHEPTRE